MQRIIECTIRTADAGKPLAEFLAGRFTYHSPTRWLELIAAGQLHVNGQPAAAGCLLQTDDRLAYLPGELPEPPVDPSYRIAYEDDWLLAIDKSGDLPCHPAGPFFKHTLWYLLKERYGDIYPVNRLDRETSGLLLAAKNAAAAAQLSRQLPQMRKRYLALVFGRFPERLEATGFLGHDPASPIRKKQRFYAEPPADGGKYQPAATLFTALRHGAEVSLIQAEPRTGRLHQIRASCQSLGYPLLGDKLYGPDERFYLKIKGDQLTPNDYERLKMSRQALHAAALSFFHPHTGCRLDLAAPPPADFTEAMRRYC